jgi:stage II sporulation protein M
MKRNKRLKIWDTIVNHVINNKKEYILVTLLFLVGIFLGVMFINNSEESQLTEITNYMQQFIEKLKNTQNLETSTLLKTTIMQNIVLAIILWFFGTTVIGIPIVFGIIMYKGFCLGYTIATVIATLGTGKGIIFILIALILQNIILIPAILAIGVSGFKLYKSIVKDRNKENIKVEVLRHTIFSVIMLCFLCISAMVEILISTNILKNFIKYF